MRAVQSGAKNRFIYVTPGSRMGTLRGATVSRNLAFDDVCAYRSLMRRYLLIQALLLALGTFYAYAAGRKPHVITFGKVQTVASFVGDVQHERRVEWKIRALYVDEKLKEYTVGPLRDITERMFVVRKAVRINDALPSETKPRWRWERAGWLSVDRSTGRVSQIALPTFDSLYSVVVWYRDYAAYCGTSGDRNKVYAIVAQLGHRKPLLRQLVEGMTIDSGAESACPAPVWERDPARVTFQLSVGRQLTFSLGESEVEELTEAESSTDPE